MNKKLKIYSALFVAVIIVMLVTSVFKYNKYSSKVFGEENLEVTNLPAELSPIVDTNGTVIFRSTFSYDVNVVPKKLPDNKELISTVGWPDHYQTYVVKMQKVKLEMPFEKNRLYNFPMVFGIITGLLTLAVFVWMLYIVFQTIRSIRNGEIFVTDVSQNLEKIGFMLSAIYLIKLITSYTITKYLINHIMMAGYYIVFKNECNIMFLLTGIALLIISQIILMGKDLKEDVDLTV